MIFEVSQCLTELRKELFWEFLPPSEGIPNKSKAFEILIRESGVTDSRN